MMLRFCTRSFGAGLCFLCLVSVGGAGVAAQHEGDKDKDHDRKPKVSLKASPKISLSAARVVLTAELQGGSNDYEEYYCPTIEWVWGDGTASESTSDCEPYEAGKSEIKRRFVVEHRFKVGGNYRVQFRLKHRDKVLTVATTDVQIASNGP